MVCISRGKEAEYRILEDSFVEQCELKSTATQHHKDQSVGGGFWDVKGPSKPSQHQGNTDGYCQGIQVAGWLCTRKVRAACIYSVDSDSSTFVEQYFK